jgi:hypothetical protein
MNVAHIHALAHAVASAGFVYLPEWNDNGHIRLFDGAGAAIDADQGTARLVLARINARQECGSVDAPLSVHARRHRKYRNDMEWLRLLYAQPGASRIGWGSVPYRCARAGYTTVRVGIERLTPAGLDAFDFHWMPF